MQSLGGEPIERAIDGAGFDEQRSVSRRLAATISAMVRAYGSAAIKARRRVPDAVSSTSIAANNSSASVSAS